MDVQHILTRSQSWYVGSIRDGIGARAVLLRPAPPPPAAEGEAKPEEGNVNLTPNPPQALTARQCRQLNILTLLGLETLPISLELGFWLDVVWPGKRLCSLRWRLAASFPSLWTKFSFRLLRLWS